jgi:hypothetical protein
MSLLQTAEPGTLAWAAQITLWLAAGIVIGALHFLSLRWSVRLFIEGRAARSLAIQGLRLTALGGALAAVAVWFGALPLLAATAGLLLARTAVLRLGAPS